MNKPILYLVAFAALWSCAPERNDDERAALLERSAAWQAALDRGDFDALAALYTADARVMAPNAPTAVGRTAVLDSFGALRAAGLSLTLATIDARAAGDIGWHVGSYRMTDADGELIDTGKFVETWERKDGAWLMSTDIWNSDLPPYRP